jgi:hypothetical protein
MIVVDVTAIPSVIAAVGKTMKGAVIVAVGLVRSTTAAEAWWCRKAWWWAICRWKMVIVGRHHVVHVAHLSRAALMITVARTNSQGVFGEAEANAALGAVMEHVAVQIMEGLGGEGDILELNETHRTIGFGTETKALVSSLFRKGCLELFLRGIEWKITNVEGVARRVLVRGVHCWHWTTEVMVIGAWKR